ncbi:MULTISPECIES: FAD-binding protein [Proteus]|uniref:Protein FixB n=1 Tax=Proteus penneri TaxID=102862 RepID=A0ABS0W589_9GAMM|nr:MULTISPECIES: FAD-binding protein [Proteus]EEG86920.1 electron transfer flavoprotein FAD-binding domain protein [Proteus penneri ATCC 35198]MBJ2118472.1 FAD-binding protein [Proteus penneri]NBM11558.1 electron transfer flavoprotein subunit alpha [Proteus sp. G2670]NBM31259.1 electron transfer flavoprotein subunit alpha [Proteus sp. G2664]NBM48725.1 electron transfer flavoprotein subunit alpha [Proteus sp. G2666]
MSQFSTVWVFSDALSRLPELMGGASSVGQSINVFTLNDEQSALAFKLGATAVFQLEGKPDDRIIEDYAQSMVETIKQKGDAGLVLLPNTRRGKLLAARLGHRLEAVVSNDAQSLKAEGDALVTKHMVYGGLAFGDETLKTPYCVVTASVGAFDVAPETGATGNAQKVAWIAPSQTIVRNSVQPRAINAVDLDKARFVVSVGRGIGSKENIVIAEELAKAIGAEIACSRPVAENEKWMEHERYVGISNLMLKPELYLAAGISGQIQHMVGANGAQTIVAINKDKNAPIFQFADYGIVGDLMKILPALTRQLSN